MQRLLARGLLRISGPTLRARMLLAISRAPSDDDLLCQKEDASRRLVRTITPGRSLAREIPMNRNVIERRMSDGGLGRTTNRKLVPEGFSLGELAARFDCSVRGDAAVRLTHVATLQGADRQAIAFVANPKYLPLLASTRAGAVILSAQHAKESPIPALIARNPYATYARVASVLHPVPAARPGTHASALIERGVQLGPGVSIGPGCIVEE